MKKLPRKEVLRLVAERKLVQTGVIMHGHTINVKGWAEEARSRGLVTAGYSGHTNLYSWMPGHAPR